MVRQGNTPVLLIKKEPSFSYHKILIATDFSEASKRAVEFAFQCFPEARFQLLHIVDIYYRQFLNVDNVGKNERNNPTKDILEKLDDFLKYCKVNHDKFDKKIIGGYFADAIIMQSKNWGADLLVFGTQGRSKLHYLLMGSVAKRLLQLSHIDMFAVPPNS
ncbi:universal stress protein [Legionella israelensis]|nr:universal stress protein [Legionella israelensis]